MARVYNIPFECDFITHLSKKILEITNGFQHPDNSLIILPHKRLKSAFLQQKILSTSKGMLLPRTITFASIDENILEFDGFCQDLSEFAIRSLKNKVITNDQLIILLTLIIEDLKQKELEFSIDFFNTLNIEQLKRAVLEYYYYQYNLNKIFPYSRKEKILVKILKKFESYLEKENLSLKAILLNKTINEIIQKWNYNSTKKIFTIVPQTDVKYISLFLDNLTQYKNAFIFVRGVDRQLYQDKESISKTHHQYHIADFLNRNQIRQILSHCEHACVAIHHLPPPSLRAHDRERGNPFLHKECSGSPRWLSPSRDDENKEEQFHDDKDENKEGYYDDELRKFNHINIVSAKDQNEEAQIISLIIREQLVKGIKSIVIQTQSIDLATKIEGFLKLWNIATDNLLRKPHKDNQAIMLFIMVGNYLNLVENDYLLLLDILKSKYCKFYDKDELREFELHYLRQYSFREKISYYFKKETAEKENFLFLLELEQIIITAKQKLKRGTKTLHEYFQIHLKVFDYLKSDFQDTDFVKLLSVIEKNLKIWQRYPHLKFSVYIKILSKIIYANSLTKTSNLDCPVKIVQTLETRNIQYDMLVFAGLNEGIFPNLNLDHRYFHPYTRVANQLKSLDIETGFMEYDFVSSLFNRNVVLSYSISLNTKSSKCRWLERILTSQKAKQRSELYTQKYRHWLQNLFPINNRQNGDTEYVNMDVHLRPNHISLSGIEKLISNPYMYYAQYILKLNHIEDIAKQSGKREFGIILHNIMSEILYKNFSNFEEYANKFNLLFEIKAKKYHVPFEIKKLWLVRIKNIIKNTYTYMCKGNVSNIFTEILGKIYLELNNRKISVSCIADRIEVMEGNKMEILDYKTGYIPTINEVKRGLYPQLAIEKLILSMGGFKEIPYSNSNNIKLSYLDISGKSISNIKTPIPVNMVEVEDGLKKLLEKFLCSHNEFFIANLKYI